MLQIAHYIHHREGNCHMYLFVSYFVRVTFKNRGTAVGPQCFMNPEWVKEFVANITVINLKIL